MGKNSPHPLLQQLTVQQLIGAFDLLPDILFWVKDSQGRIVHANSGFLEHLGFRQLEQVLNKTDNDFAPPHLAKQFITDDRKVMVGELVTERLELNRDKNGEFGWFSTSKRPLLDAQGRTLGSYGITRHLEKSSKTLSRLDAIAEPVRFVRENYPRPISVEQLAEIAHLSVSALERRFKKYLKKTPGQFINEVRLESARKLLIETRQPIAEIAYQCGFSEPSYFSKQFRRLFGELPSQLRDGLQLR